MTMQTSKIKTVIHQGDKDWNGKKLVKWLLVFENEENGTFTQFPDNPKPEVGNEMTYEITDKGFGPEIKTQKAGGGGGGFGGGKKWTPEQVAQQDAVKLTASAIEAGLDLKHYKAFFVECKSFMIQMSKEETPAQAKPTDPAQPQTEEQTDDMPF